MKLDKIGDFLKKNKVILIKIAVFLVLSLAVVPFVVSLLEKMYPRTFQYTFSFLPYSLLVLALFFAFNKKAILQYKEKINPLQTVLFSSLAFASFSFYFILTHSVLFVPQNLGFYIVISYGLYFTGFISLALAVFNLDFFHQFKKSIALSSLLTLFFFSFTIILRGSKLFMTRIVAQLSHFFLDFFYDSVSYAFGNPVTLTLKDFTAGIGAPCSGAESLSMFVGLILLLFVYDYKQIHFKKFLLVLPVGLVGVYFMNIFRISTLMVVGTHSPDLAMNLFHSNAGWILFSFFTLAFGYFFYPYIKIKNKTSIKFK